MYLVDLPYLKAAKRRSVLCASYLKAFQLASDHVRAKGGTASIYNVHGAPVAAWCTQVRAGLHGVEVRKVAYPNPQMGVVGAVGSVGGVGGRVSGVSA